MQQLKNGAMCTSVVNAQVGTLLLPNHIIDGSVLRTWLRWLQPGGVLTLSVRTDLWGDHADATRQDRVDGGGGVPTVPAVAQALESEGTSFEYLFVIGAGNR